MPHSPSDDDWGPARLEARAVAFAIDALVLLAIAPVFVALAGLTVLLQTDWLAVDPRGREWMWGYLVGALYLLAPALYLGLATWRGGTVGARFLGLRVRATTGAPLRMPLALARALLWYVELLILGVGFLGAAFDRRGRTLADRLTGTQMLERAVIHSAQHPTAGPA
jgi:uncharacterized RDD family membrane protein YckC